MGGGGGASRTRGDEKISKEEKRASMLGEGKQVDRDNGYEKKLGW